MLRRWTVGFCLWVAIILGPADGEELRIQLDTNNRPALRWTVEGDRFFRLEFAETFPATNWTFAPGTGLNSLATNNEILGQNFQLSVMARFYRLRSIGVLSNNVVHTVVDAAGSGDHATIAAALASLPPEGGVVVMRAGTYAGGLTIPSRVTLRGEGAGQTRILAPFWSGTGARTEAVTVAGDDVVIEGLEVDGQRASQPAVVDLNGLITVTGARAAIRNCRLVNAINHGVSLLAAASDAVVENCEILNTATNNLAAGAEGAQQAGVRCQDAVRPVLRNNLVRGWGLGMVLASGVTNGIVIGNEFTDFGQGITTTGLCSGILIQSNSFPRLSSNAVAIYAAGGDAHQILGNVILATNFAVGIQLEAGTNQLVSSNMVTMPGQHLLVRSADNRIEGNRLEKTGPPDTGMVRIESPAAVRNIAVNNILIGFNADSIAFHIVGDAAATTATNNLILRATPSFLLGGAGPGNFVTTLMPSASQVFVGPLGTDGTVLGQPPGVRLESGALTIVSTNLAYAMTLLPEGGGTVTVDDGVYDGAFELPRNTVVRGQGMGRTVIRALLDGVGQVFRAVGSNVLIEAMTVDGRRSAYSVLPSAVIGVNGVISVAGADVTVRNCVVRDAPNNGVFVDVSVPGFLIENCVVENSATNNVPQGTPGGHGYGIFCAGSASPVIRSNVVRGWAQGVGLWPGVTNGLVENNQIVNNFGFIDAAHTTHRSACEDYGAGVVPHGWNLWRSNLVDGSTASCLEIAQGVTASRFVGNTLRRPGQISDYGNHVDVTGGSGQTNRDVVIEGNTIISDGLRVDTCAVNGLAYNTVFSNNTFTGFTNAGNSVGLILLGATVGVRGTVIVSNTFNGCRFGVRVNGDATDFLVRGNIFTDVRQSDAAIWADSTGTGRIEDNLITGTQAMVGILLSDTANAGHAGTIVSGNHVTLPASSLFCLTSNNVITNNVFNETIADGPGTILMTGSNVLGNLVAGNTINTLSPWAIRLSTGANFNTITNNILSSATVRIDESAGTNNVVTGN